MKDQILPQIRERMDAQRALIMRPNEVDHAAYNGIYDRYKYPVLTGDHVPIDWRYDLNPATNPYGMERLGINTAFNAGAIEYENAIYLMARVEGADRKSFFGLARSVNGVDGFEFVDGPIVMPETDDPDINVYDMRFVRHEDGHIYGLFCTERKDPSAGPGDTHSAMAQCGIARTTDLIHWERLPDFKSPSQQQRNVVLHPEFFDGQYAFYTRPMDGFIDTGSGGGIGWGLCKDMTRAQVESERIFAPRRYHTVYELKNGQGPAPLKTPEGWLHIAHGVRASATGLKYVLYVFMTDLAEPWRVTHEPGGHFIAAQGHELLGDLHNVIFCNGAVQRADGEVLIYYASCDTRMHVARTSVDRLLDYVKNTPPDPLRSALCVQQRRALWESNQQFLADTQE